MSRSPLATSAQVVLYVNGRSYAQVTGFNWSSVTPPKAIYGLDSGEPYELAPTITKVTGTVGLLRMVGDGGLEGAGIAPHLPDLPRGRYFSLALIHRGTDITIFRSDRCWVVSQSWDVPSKGRVSGSMTFEGFDWSNEAAS